MQHIDLRSKLQGELLLVAPASFQLGAQLICLLLMSSLRLQRQAHQRLWKGYNSAAISMSQHATESAQARARTARERMRREVAWSIMYMKRVHLLNELLLLTRHDEVTL